jgi:hypothetical protein
MHMHVFRLRRVLGQVADEGARFRHRPANDGADMRRQIQGFAPGHRMRAHQPLAHRGKGTLLLRREVVEAQHTARIDQRMLAHQVLDLRLGAVIEVVIGGAHVGELGVAAVIGHGAAGQQGELGRHGAEAAVGMPELVAQVEHPPPVVARQRLVVLVEVGHVGQFRRQTAVGVGGDVAVPRPLDLAEIAAVGDLLVVGEALVVEHQDRVAVHARFDSRGLLGRKRLGDVDAGHLTHEKRVQLADFHAHGGASPL